MTFLTLNFRYLYLGNTHHQTFDSAHPPEKGDHVIIHHSAVGQDATLDFIFKPDVPGVWRYEKTPCGHQLPTSVSYDLGEPSVITPD